MGARNGPIDTQNVTQKVLKARNYCLIYISARELRANGNPKNSENVGSGFPILRQFRAGKPVFAAFSSLRPFPTRHPTHPFGLAWDEARRSSAARIAAKTAAAARAARSELGGQGQRHHARRHRRYPAVGCLDARGHRQDVGSSRRPHARRPRQLAAGPGIEAASGLSAKPGCCDSCDSRDGWGVPFPQTESPLNRANRAEASAGCPRAVD